MGCCEKVIKVLLVYIYIVRGPYPKCVLSRLECFVSLDGIFRFVIS